jgi:hypothetical protein
VAEKKMRRYGRLMVYIERVAVGGHQHRSHNLRQLNHKETLRKYMVIKAFFITLPPVSSAQP